MRANVRVLNGAGVVVLAVLCGVSAFAHEIGTTRVSVALKEGRTYEIEVVTDATALGEKLAAYSGTAAVAIDDPGRLQSLLNGSDAKFRQRVKIAFDGQAVQPAIEYAVTPRTDAMSAPAAAIRLTGAIPPGAKDFTWKYAWTFASYSMTVRNASSGAPITVWLEGGDTSAPIAVNSPARPGGEHTAWRYLALGFTHILPNGLDHMLFVLGIYLLSGRARSVLWQVSAFTIAHSITLGLSMYGVVTVAPQIVEPVIALSIAYVAIENIFLKELKSWRVALVFCFGLLHGLGFAGALKEIGLPRAEFLTALLTFNAGVEAGQLAVIGAAFLLVGWQYSQRAWYRSRIVVPASMAIACVAVYWTIERFSF